LVVENYIIQLGVASLKGMALGVASMVPKQGPIVIAQAENRIYKMN
jgi:hypothetical protein